MAAAWTRLVCVLLAMYASPVYAQVCDLPAERIDWTTLEGQLRAAGLQPIPEFRALVAVIDLHADATPTVQVFGVNPASLDLLGWNPASTVKLYAAVGAIEELRARGAPDPREIEFSYPHGKRRWRFHELLWQSIQLSDNIAHDRLMQIAGFDRVHGAADGPGPPGLLARAGLAGAAVRKAYGLHAWRREGQPVEFVSTPAYAVRQGRRWLQVPARTGQSVVSCPKSACTSLQQLASFLCRVMLHEQLPASERLQLSSGPRDRVLLLQLRDALSRRRERPDGTWQAFADAFPARRGQSHVYKKGGLSEGWVSDNVFIRGRGGRRFLVALAGKGGHDDLDPAARLIAGLLRKDALVPPLPEPQRKRTRARAHQP